MVRRVQVMMKNFYRTAIFTNEVSEETTQRLPVPMITRHIETILSIRHTPPLPLPLDGRGVWMPTPHIRRNGKNRPRRAESTFKDRRRACDPTPLPLPYTGGEHASQLPSHSLKGRGRAKRGVGLEASRSLHPTSAVSPDSNINKKAATEMDDSVAA